MRISSAVPYFDTCGQARSLGEAYKSNFLQLCNLLLVEKPHHFPQEITHFLPCPFLAHLKQFLHLTGKIKEKMLALDTV
jgi:hypothetical protein